MNTIKNEILSDIRKSKKNIKIAVAWLTDKDFIKTLCEQLQRKKSYCIEIVVSNHADNKEPLLKEKISDLITLGAIVKTMGSANPQHGDFMHCKFYIIDDEFAKSGSYNWSRGAERNIECLDMVPLEPKQKLFKRLIGNGNSYPTLKYRINDN